jgi:dGTPase
MKINTSFWNSIIIPERLGAIQSKTKKEHRSVFDMDHDRIIYSNFFRRMHDKTQVFPYAPLSSSGQARSRLSHSLEVSCAARSLGMLLGEYLQKHGADINPHDTGMVCASACLAHDIGNPPFGHSGEFAIQHWAKNNLTGVLTDDWERADFEKYEGNAQGFRILTRLETWQREGGLRPTIATLCAFTKYPCSSLDVKSINLPGVKKHGYFKSDSASFISAFDKSNLSPVDSNKRIYPRHVLAYVTEAADDICYAVVDLEDAYHLGVVSFETVYDFLMPIVSQDPTFEDSKDFDFDIRIARLRSATISILIQQAFSVIVDSINALERSEFNQSVISKTSSADFYEDIYAYSMEHIYSSNRVLEIECAGFQTIGGLLDTFVNAILTEKPTSQDSVIRRIIPLRYFKRYEIKNKSEKIEEILKNLTPYERLLSVTDFISGMTDRYAVELYQRLSGIKLPVY